MLGGRSQRRRRHGKSQPHGRRTSIARRRGAARRRPRRGSVRWSGTARRPRRATARRSLHVYDIGTLGLSSAVNCMLRPLGMGAFHCGVEVYQWEWSYADTGEDSAPEQTGVFCCPPRGCGGHTYCTSQELGRCAKSRGEVLALWGGGHLLPSGHRYDVLTKNCGHFCDAFCRTLGVRPVPAWVTRLAATGKACEAGGCCCRSGPSTSAHDEIDVLVPVEARAWHARSNDGEPSPLFAGA
ncbi:unnamed protein product [Prorocentrum cordatum]|uniref:PPPDE domain-containing protein n=1 Tax=Prorocentrum cordatum TaxID=2364126 RepID=A0ABN9Y1C1_9DINO|nr:unnamed protein product [Polarella glacialis]